jgi:hypothetical protein
MRRFIVSLSVVVVLLLGVVATLGRGATAQEATPDTAAMMAMATHPIVGEWRNINELGEGIVFPSLAIYHADGTFIEDYPDESSYSMGVWEPTGERTATVTVYQVYVIDDKLANGEGRWTAEVDETGNELRTAGTFVGTFEDGSIDIAVEWSADDGPPATRLGVLPVVPLSELVPGGTPVIPTDMTEEATPAP